MKAIKFVFSTIIILAILIFLVAPPVIGLWIKHNYTDTIAEINKQNPNLTVSVSHYDFGWFKSKATIRIDFHIVPTQANQDMKSANDNIRINADATILQGPLVYAKHAGKHRLYFALADIKSRIPTLNLTGHTIWHFSNTLTSQFSSPEFTLRQHKSTVTMKNLQGMVNYNLSSKRMQLNMSIDRFAFADWVILNKLNYSANLNQEGLINLGQQKLTLDNIKINTGQETVNIDNISASSNTTQNGDSVNMIVNYNIQSISDNPLGLNSVQIDFAIKNVNTKSLNTLLKALQDQQNQSDPQHMQYQQLITPGMNLLRQGLNIQVNHIYLKTTDGTVSVDGNFTIPKLAKNTTLLQVPMMMKADFHIQAPKTWVKQQLTTALGWFQQPSPHQQPKNPSDLADQTLQQWENQNLLISNGNNYKARIQFQNGHLLINGKVPQKPHPIPNNHMKNDQNDLNSNNGQPRTDAQ